MCVYGHAPEGQAWYALNAPVKTSVVHLKPSYIASIACVTWLVMTKRCHLVAIFMFSYNVVFVLYCNVCVCVSVGHLSAPVLQQMRNLFSQSEPYTPTLMQFSTNSLGNMRLTAGLLLKSPPV